MTTAAPDDWVNPLRDKRDKRVPLIPGRILAG